MVFEPQKTQMFDSDGVNIAWFDAGAQDAEPVLLIHGFASTAHVNWVFTGWVRTLNEAGYRVIAFDHRGHGESDKPHDEKLYTPDHMADDAIRLLSFLGVESAHIMGYSMGARVSAFIAKREPQMVKSVIFGGLGIGMVEGVGDWDPIADALLAPSLDDVSHERGRMFRAFADQTKSDRFALAACIRTSRVLVTKEEMARMAMPALIAIGTEDDIAGSGEELAALMPHAEFIPIPRRDHMLSVGDKVYKSAVLEFLSR